MRKRSLYAMILTALTLLVGIVPLSVVNAEEANILTIYYIDDNYEANELSVWYWGKNADPINQNEYSTDSKKFTVGEKYSQVDLNLKNYEAFELGMILLHNSTKFQEEDIKIDIPAGTTEVWINSELEYFFEDPNQEVNQDFIRIHFKTDSINLEDVKLWGWNDFADGYKEGNWPADHRLATGVDNGFVYFDMLLKEDAQTIGFLFVNSDLGFQTNDYIYTIDSMNRNVYVQEGDPSVYHSSEMTNAELGSAVVLSENQIRLNLGNNHGYDEASLKNTFKLYADETEIMYEIDELSQRVGIISVDNPIDIKQDWEIKYDNRSVSLYNEWNYIDSVYATEKDLGLTWENQKATLNFWSPSATSVEVVIYSKDDQTQEIARIPMSEIDNVWTKTLEPSDVYDTTLQNYYYQYYITRDNKGLYVLDPYAKSMATWNGLDKAGCDNTQPQCIGKGAFVNVSDIGVSLDYADIEGFESSEDAIIYEVHVRDFTSDETIEDELINQFGTFSAFIEKLDYIEDLGVTHIQLLPVMSYYNINENNSSERTTDYSLQGESSNYNWGYDPHSYFSLTGEYSLNSDEASLRIEEYKKMIDEIHSRGMGVIMDVVYNHTAQVSIFEDLEPNYYHFMDSAGISKTSFGGGRLGTTHAMASRVLVDSITYWTDEFKIDGFRLDMMGDHDAASIQLAYDKASTLNPNTVFLGEGWTTYAGDDDYQGVQPADQSWMKLTDDVGVFSDEIRNELKSGFGSEGQPRFLTGGARNISTIFNNIKAQPGNFIADSPQDVITYIEAHDNLTLHDVIAQSIKKDPSTDESEILQRQRLGNLMVLTSQGTAFLHAGQEYGRTKQVIDDNYKTVQTLCPGSGDTYLHKGTCMTDDQGTPFEYPYFIHDSYNSSDIVNRFDWSKVRDETEYSENVKTKEYTRGLIELRRSTDAFTLSSKSDVDSKVKQLSLSNQSSEDLILGYYIDDIDYRYYVLLNADDTTRTLGVDYTTLEILKSSDVLVDSNQAGINPIATPVGISFNSDVSIDALSGVVLRISQDDLETIGYTKNETSKIDDGTVLHTWNWSFKTISDNLEDIKEAGYTAIQTSPVQPTKEIASDGSKWWLLYQPIDFSLGNQLGTEEEFVEMVTKAKELDIEIIVDVVLNHMANEGGDELSCVPNSNIRAELLNSNYWHQNGCSIDYSNRTQVTQNGIGLPDLNTSNHELQDIMIDYLNYLEDLGVDGFRFDAAKHIELPNDSGVTSDFWPNVLGSLQDTSYVYGEVIQDTVDELTKYAAFMDVTATNYGFTLRNAVTNKNVNGLVNYQANNLGAKDLVTWVESHDNYANDDEQSTYLSDEDIILAWSLLASRKENTPLFFARPDGSKFADEIGKSGSELWKDPTIKAINDFHNKFKSEDEYILQPNDTTLIITRGVKGMVIVNVGDTSVNLNQNVFMGDGVYENTLDTTQTYTIENSKLVGTVEARSVIIIEFDETKPQVKFTPINDTFTTDSLDINVEVENATEVFYRLNAKDGSVEWLSFDNTLNINIGSGDMAQSTYTIEIKAINEKGTQIVTKTYTKALENNLINVYYNKPSDWGNTIYIYVYNDEGNLGSWPGTVMNLLDNGWYQFSFPEGYLNGNILFSDGSGKQYPLSGEPGIYVDETLWIDQTEVSNLNPTLDYTELDLILNRYLEEINIYSTKNTNSLRDLYHQVLGEYNHLLTQEDVDEWVRIMNEKIDSAILLQLEIDINILIAQRENIEAIQEQLDEIKELWDVALTQEEALGIQQLLIELQIPTAQLDYTELSALKEHMETQREQYAIKNQITIDDQYSKLLDAYDTYTLQEEIDDLCIQINNTLETLIPRELETSINDLIAQYDRQQSVWSDFNQIKVDWNNSYTKSEAELIYDRLLALEIPTQMLNYTELEAVIAQYTSSKDDYAKRDMDKLDTIFNGVQTNDYTTQDEIDQKVIELKTLLNTSLTRLTEEKVESLYKQLLEYPHLQESLTLINTDWIKCTTEAQGLNIYQRLLSLNTSALDYSGVVDVYNRLEKEIDSLGLKVQEEILEIFANEAEKFLDYRTQEEIDKQVQYLNSLLDNALLLSTEIEINSLFKEYEQFPSLKEELDRLANKWNNIQTEKEAQELLKELKTLKPTEKNGDELPQTGMNIMVTYTYVGLLLITLGSWMTFKRKKIK